MYLQIFDKIGLAFVMLVLITGCTEQKYGTSASEKSRNQRWVEDIAYFESEYLNGSKTFPRDSISSCKLILAILKAQVDSLSDNQLILQLSKCVAMANNGHTAIPLGFMKKVPLRFYRFSKGLHIIKTDSSSKKILGAKVLMINSVKIEEVEQRLFPYLSGIERWKKFKATNYLSSPEILNGIGLSEKDSMTLTLLRDKDTLEITFGAKEMKDNKAESWSDLYPQSSDMDWCHVLVSNTDKPLYLEFMNEGVFYTFIDSIKLSYFSINGYWDMSEDFKGKIREFIDGLKIRTDYDVVIDLRYFSGGNYIVPVDIATEPPKIIDTDKNIYLITTNMTFSAGLVTAARVKYYAKNKIVVVGEEVGDNLKFWAERDIYQLPNSKIVIADADAEHDWQDNNFTLGKSFWVNAFYGVPAKSLNVDKEIKLSFEDYMNGKDPILSWIINHVE